MSNAGFILPGKVSEVGIKWLTYYERPYGI